MLRIAPAPLAVIATIIAVLILVLPSESHAEPGVAVTGNFGAFFEFGDENGFGGGFTLWVGSAIYPDVDPEEDAAAFFIAPGLELRTGFIPILTGPNQISPQIRTGVAWMAPPGEMEDQISTPENLTFTDVKLQAILGYRWAFAFGWDNMDGEREDEQAFRFGLNVTAPALIRLADPIPVLNMLEGFIDVNLDGSLDRGGFSVGVGF